MNQPALLKRIELNPQVVAGKPVIRGSRLTVQYILGLLANGASPQEILEEYAGLELEDIQACLVFAAEALNEPFLPLNLETA